MLAEISVLPTGETHMSKDVAHIIEALEKIGIDYRLCPMGTCVEGDWDEVMAAIRACHESVAGSHRRVLTRVVIDDRRDGAHHLDEMITSVERHLGHTAKHSS